MTRPTSFLNPLMLSLCFFSFIAAHAQPTYNANTRVNAYSGNFTYGANMGYYPPWDDKTLADIAAGNTAKNVKGAGVKSLRPSLPEHFLEQWGYTIRVSHFNHYASLGIVDNTVFIGHPSAAHKDPTMYCANSASNVFKNMYTPIWDGGANGTPVNDNNYYALYLYKMVTLYKNNVKFWEIWNEPDFTNSGNGNKAAGVAGNWWDNNPNPCDLVNLKAPIQHYVRILRISYEVIKTIDPTAYVAIGGIGYASFVDAVLRNTDNPTNGSVTSEYPNKGGAYFDVVSYHSYPQHSLKTWSNAIGGFVYRRHSDAASEEPFNLKKKFETVLANRGYNGTTYPKKLYIITECNIGRKEFGDAIGSDAAQKNFIIKTLVKAQKNEVRQFYVYTMGDSENLENTTSSYQSMGLYKKLKGVSPYQQQINNQGIAYKTTSNLLFGYTYDATKTQAMALPVTVDGGAFRNSQGAYMYVLWAKTIVDRSEVASAVYTFPTSFNVAQIKQRQWNYSSTLQSSAVNSRSITLTAEPVFLTTISGAGKNSEEDLIETPDVAEKKITIIPNPATESGAKATFTVEDDEKVSLYILNSAGQSVRRVLENELLTKGEQVVNLNIEGLPSGMYFVHLSSARRREVGKLIINR